MSKQAPWGQPGVYSATPPTLADGDGSALQVDSSGNLKISGTITGSDIEIGAVELKDATTANRAVIDSNGNLDVSLGTLIAGEDLTANVLKVEQRFSYQAISTATTTTIKSGAGFLHTIAVTGGTAGTIAVTDNTTSGGTAIATYSSTNAISNIIFDVAFTTGLTIVTGAATNITVSYR